MQENNQTQHLFAKTLELEKQLRAASKTKGPLEKSAFQLRDALRESYEKLIFLDYEFATSKDIEVNLWKNAFYKVIEEFRKRIRKAISKSQEQSQSQNSDRTGAAFKTFLDQSSHFYNNLIAKLQTTFQLKLDKPVPEDLSDTNSTLYKQYLSCHRSLTYLGDLARYIRDINPKSRDWMASAEYYKRALKLMPTWGNPHNQLAVLNTYCDDEFNAVYQYFRSLAVTHPFLTARDNLNVLLEKNKIKVEGSSPSSQSSAKGRQQKEYIEDADLTPEVRSFLPKFIRLHGIMFTKSNLDAYPELETKVLTEFDRLLGKELINDIVLLKIFAINIFTFNSINSVPDGITPSYIEIAQRTDLHKYSLSLCLEMFLSAMRAVVRTNLRLPKLTRPLSIFSDWMKFNFLYLKKSDFPQPNKWESMRETTASFLNYIMTILRANNSEDISDSIVRPLSEELELQGFLPLKESFQLVDFQAPPILDIVSPKNIDDRVLGTLKRMNKIKAFGIIIANYQVPDAGEKFVYYNADTDSFSSRPIDDENINTQDQAVSKLSQINKPNRQQDLDDASFSTPPMPAKGVPLSSPKEISEKMHLLSTNGPDNYNNTSFMHIDASLSMEPQQMDQDDEEVILFKPNTNNTIRNDIGSQQQFGAKNISDQNAGEIRSSPVIPSSNSQSSQQMNMPPLVPPNNASDRNGPTGWDLFASQPQQPPTNKRAPGPPLATQPLGGQLYGNFGGGYNGTYFGQSTPAPSNSNNGGYGTQGSQSGVGLVPPGAFYGSSTDFNNPFGNAVNKQNILPGHNQNVNAGQNSANNNVPSVFNSIWSSEPTDKKSPRYMAMPHVAVNAPPGFSTVNGESVIENPFNRSGAGRGSSGQMPPAQLIQMAINMPGFTQLPLLQQQQILSQLQQHAMQSNPFS